MCVAAAAVLWTVLAGPAPVTAADAGALAADAATASRLQAHRYTFHRLTSVQADVLTRTHLPPSRTLGRVVLRGADAYYRVADVAGGTQHVAQESVVTATEQWTLNFPAGIANRVDLARVRREAPHVTVPNGASDVLDVFANIPPGSVEYVGPTIREGRALDRFRVTVPLGNGPPGELLVWILPADGVPRRLELHSPTGRLLLEREFANVKVNAPVPDALFTVIVPSDMTVHDLTDDYVGRGGEAAAPEGPGAP